MLPRLAPDETTDLPAPERVRAEIPCPPRAAATVQRGRRALRDALHGRDPRLVAITGPCSIHDPEAALEYARRLRGLALGLEGELIVLMRTFVEKPRTTTGWKGLVSDPDLDGAGDVARGLGVARRLLRDIGALGLPCATEVLDPLVAPYLDDLVAWGGIGARTVESQVHRQLASGLPYPVGFKNSTAGGLDLAVNALRAAGEPHHFPGLGADGRVVLRHSRGNPDGHVVLRGGADGPNHGAVAAAAAALADRDLARPVLVDCSHENSGGDPTRQGAVLRAVLRRAEERASPVLGFMLESFLEAGRQPFSRRGPLRFGVSITDGCIGWNETADLLCEAAEVAKRLKRASGVLRRAE